MSFVFFESQPKSFWGVLLSNGFRPLFLCVGLAGLLLIAFWIPLFAGHITLPLGMSSVLWHAHEMLFGFVGAAMGGFLLAAVSKWTGRFPVSGAALALLVVLWMSGRVAMLLSGALPAWLVATVDVSYGLCLAALVGREIIASGNRRNYKVIVLLLVFAALNGVYHCALALPEWDPNIAIRGAVMQICMMLSLIGGRITPAFTRNYLMKQNPALTLAPAAFGRLDIAATLTLLAAALSWIALPAAVFSAYLLMVAGLLQIMRLVRWKGWLALDEPLLWILHIGFVWLGLGLVLLGAGALDSSLGSVGFHGLGIGAMASMILGVASRAALGHTKRPLVAGKLMTAAFMLLSGAAVLRILASLLVASLYWPLLYGAALLWLAGMLLFCIRYVPILVKPVPNWRYPGA